MPPKQLSTAEERRPLIAAAALRAFARGGYAGTTVAEVAREAGISAAYVFKLFPGKEQLFVAALDACFDQIETSLAAAPAAPPTASPTEILNGLGAAYAELIADRTLLLIQVHAQSVATIPPIGDALRHGLARITQFATEHSGGTDDDVQRFIAYGQLCHLITTAGVAEIDEPWARTLAHNIRHSESGKRNR